MKAITLYQPWASMVAMGIKRLETRSWFTPYRGPLAIHAAKYVVPAVRDELRMAAEQYMGQPLADFPRGVIVATVTLQAARRTEDMPQEVHDIWGDFARGRWIWILTDVRRMITHESWHRDETLSVPLTEDELPAVDVAGRFYYPPGSIGPSPSVMSTQPCGIPVFRSHDNRRT